MKAEEVKKYVGKKVLLILKNNFKYTVTIPQFEEESFTVTDRYNNRITIECDMISLISEVGRTPNNE